MAKKNQSGRLTDQHKLSQGVVGIFGDGAKLHDLAVGKISKIVMKKLEEEYPQLNFRYRSSIKKSEINEYYSRLTMSWVKHFLSQTQV